MDIDQIGKIIPKETIDKFYADAVSAPAKELGKLGGDVGKTLRLLLAPIQVLGALQDRLEPMLERIRKRVPDERRIEAPPEVVGPALERMRYLPDESELWTMFEEILTKSVDKSEVVQVHPSFPTIISQLSRDEAWMIYRLRDKSFNVVDILDLVENRFENRKFESSELPIDELQLPSQLDLYYAHLESLSLVIWPVNKQELIMAGEKQTGIRRFSTMMLTDFGRLFASACIPPDGFKPSKSVNEG
ncbi:Abi-alpha family protein [Hyphomicrobium sulfonivorans]|uniref:Abi-alpha family protein n=1 Tax=Hyphomicrobium sulfonivorans TaxID=121290 RepID=UPI00156EE9A4|nr:Abi-alpha family protein [Hyphomicrobium sulfonivorans]MBI1648975.1 DUF4393 domain-containing protein [Hyphomicrobium sulfonivorans]NSL70490.1 hypothetical protein [Hyphomicrobium sulfonivorans]